MLSELLLDIEELAPVYPGSGGDAENWKSLTDEFAPRVFELGSSLRAALESILGASTFKSSIDSCLVGVKPSHILSEYQIRPEDRYYEHLGRPIPAPKNPTGPHATGISLGVLVTRSATINGSIQRPAAYLIFNVWGREERQAFSELLSDFRRPIKMIVGKYGFEFSTAVPFYNVEKLRTRDAFRLLSAYLENENDPESAFTLTAQFCSEGSFAEIIKAAVPLAMLYHTAEGYAQKRKEKDRVLKIIMACGKF